MATTTTEFIEHCRQRLEQEWAQLQEALQRGNLADPLADIELREMIYRAINSKTLSYRFVLPTQLLAKLVNPDLNAHSLQSQWEVTGAFDARTIAHKVIVPFNQQHANVLGPSAEPYVNNPLRVPAVIHDYARQQKDKAGWQELVTVLERVQTCNAPEFTVTVFQQVLLTIYRRLQQTSVTYPVPLRVSLETTLSLLGAFLQTPSGGRRPQYLTAALLETIGKRFNLYAQVRTGPVTAADAASGLSADIECLDSAGRVVLSVEVKDRPLSMGDVQAKVTHARQAGISEILFIAQKGVTPANGESLREFLLKEFASGHNIYIENLLQFAQALLILLGEEGRVEFLHQVGHLLDRLGSPLEERQAWATLLHHV